MHKQNDGRDGAAFVLWFRPGPGCRWQQVAAGDREADLTGELLRLPSGEFVTLPAGQTPYKRPVTVR